MTEQEQEQSGPAPDVPDPSSTEASEAPIADPVVEAADDGTSGAAPPPTATPGTAAPAAPAADRPHYLSMIAFALGLAGILAPGIHSLAAIVLGHIGLAKEPSGRTFAIIGLVAGYAVTAMFIIGVVILISIWGVVLSSIIASVPFGELRMR